tara:strand:- start:39160 stop:39624 length:465 start_codon:yes stop_codon:yes gene_type:complete
MPDWVSHILIGLIIAEIFNLKPKSLVVLGALLPDFLFKIAALGVFINIPVTELYWTLLPIHLPLGTLFVTLIISTFFRFNYTKTIILISIGTVTHYSSDALFKSFLINPQTMLFFPLSWRMFSFDLLWANQFFIVLIISILVYGIVKIIKKNYH